jgi:hypothetical protein
MNFQEELEIQISEYFETCKSSLDEVLQVLKIKYKPNAIDKECDVDNIDFSASIVTDEDLDELYIFSSLVT